MNRANFTIKLTIGSANLHKKYDLPLIPEQLYLDFTNVSNELDTYDYSYF